MKNTIILFVLIIVSISSYSQIKWQLKDSVIKFPKNWGSWIQRNIGNYNPYSEPIGTKTPSFQLKETGDFNKDGFTDLCMELNLRFFDTNNPSNPGKYQDSLMNYYKGIFINQKNGTFLLDTNYIIHGRGAIWDGGFGDFNGDGLVDYFNNCIYYEFDPKNKDSLFYRYGRNDGSPSHVYFNNGKSFDRIDLDTIDLISTNSDIVDINNDGRDEIIATVSAKFIVYQYDIQNKSFIKRFNNINEYINKKYGNTIKFMNFKERSNNSILITLSYNFTDKKEDWMIDILNINLSDSSITVKNSFKHPSYKLNDGSLAMAGIADKKGTFKYEDINKDGSDELLWLGYFSFNNSLPSVFQSNERMGINVIENNIVNTQKYWNYDTTEIGFRVGGYIQDLNEDKISEIISEEWLFDSTKKYFGYYYMLDSGMYKKIFINTANKNIVIKKPQQYKYHTWSEDFDKDGSANIIVYDPDNVMNNYMYKSINCKDIISKPLFNSSNFNFCAGDSLKLSITNVNKGDTLKWYFGTKSDITNVTNKTFNDSSKVFVTRTDSLGCMISSDTIQLKKFAIPNSPSLSRDADNNLVSNSVSNIWYKDGVKIADTTQKIKPTTNGIYTATTTQNGCSSALSQGYYYLTNAVANLSNAEYFKISPNPTLGELNINYKISSSRNISIS